MTFWGVIRIRRNNFRVFHPKNGILWGFRGFFVLKINRSLNSTHCVLLLCDDVIFDQLGLELWSLLNLDVFNTFFRYNGQNLRFCHFLPPWRVIFEAKNQKKVFFWKFDPYIHGNMVKKLKKYNHRTVLQNFMLFSGLIFFKGGPQGLILVIFEFFWKKKFSKITQIHNN